MNLAKYFGFFGFLGSGKPEKAKRKSLICCKTLNLINYLWCFFAFSAFGLPKSYVLERAGPGLRVGPGPNYEFQPSLHRPFHCPYRNPPGALRRHPGCPGSTQETPSMIQEHPGDTQGHPEPPRRHPGCTQEHPGDNQENPGCTQEAPRRHPGDTQEPPRSHSETPKAPDKFLK